MKTYYYGVWDTRRQAGHSLHGPGGVPVHRHEADELPFRYTIADCGLIPVKAQHRGPYFAQVNGWTFLSYLDQTGDTRPGSCSVFIVEGLHTEPEMKEIAACVFPEIWCRMFGVKAALT